MKTEEMNCARRIKSVTEKGHRQPRLYTKLFTPIAYATETVTQRSNCLVTVDFAFVVWNIDCHQQTGANEEVVQSNMFF